jgi:phosphatidylglycerophosphatase A
VFDIVKPWPVSWADRKIKGGLGVMLDDILAGVYGGAILIVVAWVFGERNVL